MDTKAVQNKRTDGIDLQRFQAMIQSESWTRFRKRVEMELSRAVQACLGADSDLDVKRAQGEVRALKAVLGIPAQIENELKAPVKPRV